MKIISTTIVAAMLLMAGTAYAQQTQQERLTQHVYYLASDSLRGRSAGSPDAAKAAEYIVQQLEEIGVEPYFEGGWFHTFRELGYTNTFRNIVGIIRGTDPTLSEELVVIGAHYDHLGIKRGQIYNGADDNASGTATIIEMARLLKAQQQHLKRSVLVVAFDAEEIGLYGSNALANELDVSKVKLMMSIDMVGWLHKGKSLQLQGVATIKDGKKLLTQEAKRMNLKISAKDFETGIFTATDTRGFAKKHVPTLAITTGTKSPYHKPEDDAELIDYQGLDQITTYLAEVTEQLATDDDLQASGRIASIHRNKKVWVGASLSLATTQITFPDAGLDSRPLDGLEAGLAMQAHLNQWVGLELKALYGLHQAKFPDESNLYGSYLSYRQHSVVVPAMVMLTAMSSYGLWVYLGAGGYYARTLNASVSDMPQLKVNPNQCGLEYKVGFRVGHLDLNVGRRYQLNRLFTGTEAPKAKLYTFTINVGWMF